MTFGFGDAIFSGASLLIISVVIISIWVVIEVKRFKHKIFAIFLIILIIILYWGVIVVFQDREIDLTTVSGMTEATKIYFSWFGSIFENLKTLTSNVIRMDWSQNFTTNNNI
jgi:hypothetical protein|tara:strand:+ start:185 stop:520 length:336 start_codon:yes stop_codon:yes gene_type:complete